MTERGPEEQADPDPPEADADPPEADAEPVVEADAEPSAASERSGGVTMPVAVPVTVALVLGLAVGLIAGWLLPRPGDSGAGDTVAQPTATADGAPADGGTAGEGAAQPAQVLNPPAPVPVPGGPDGSEEVAGLVIGTEGQLVETFEDYVCPFCARFELSSGAQLRQAALDGQYRLVLHPIAFLTEDSPRASNASACVYQHEELDTWIEFHETVYERQNPSEAAGQYTNEVLVGIADEVGASTASTDCITGGDYLEWVEAITQQAFERGVRGTPTLALEGTVTDVSPFVQ